ncbi:Signal recognition particle subunit SRP72 [Smittium culicis]|uniref:Signal recognition particle subunit SRP72 n=1 Tax=Smittium culicis TaxID=133412 RepID=A0A1R1YDM4_9FUNG|nr:Signal recognition particle subunit SRP72 [Smittium culicis]
MDSIEELYKELYSNINDREYEAAADICDKISQIKPRDSVARKTKVVCYMKLEKYSEAISLISDGKKGNHFSATELAFEEAYCLFCLDKLNSALRILESLGETERVLLLKAQVKYKQSEYLSSIETYKQILNIDDIRASSSEINNNLNANYAALKLSDHTSELGTLDIDEESVEDMFNNSLYLLKNGETQKSLDTLTVAIEMCREVSRNEGYSEKEIANELAPLNLQLGYIYYIMGDVKKASFAWRELESNLDSEKFIKSLSQINNKITQNLSSKGAIMRAVNLLTNFQKSSIFKSFNKSQKISISYNKAALLYKAKEFKAAKKALLSIQLSSIDKKDCDLFELKLLTIIQTSSKTKAINYINENLDEIRPNKRLAFIILLSELIDSRSKSQVRSVLDILSKYINNGSPIEPISLAPVICSKLASFTNGSPSMTELNALSLKLSDILRSQSIEFNEKSGNGYLYAGIAGFLVNNLDLSKHFVKKCLENDPNNQEALLFSSILSPTKNNHEKLSRYSDLLKQASLADSISKKIETKPKKATGSKNKKTEKKAATSTKVDSKELKAQIYLPGVPKKVLINNLSRANKHRRKLVEAKVGKLLSKKKETSIKKKKEIAQATGKKPAGNKDVPTGGRRKDGEVDPERWIPLRMRSYYKIKGKNRKYKSMRGGAQGQVSQKELDRLNANDGIKAGSSKGAAGNIAESLASGSGIKQMNESAKKTKTKVKKKILRIR